jgi:hypothetical protein
MRGYLDEKKANRGPKHVHTVEGFGLDADEIRERFDDYCQRFDLAS